MKWSETSIGRALAQQTFNRKYLVVVPNCNWTGYECDLLAVTENLRLIDVEIKISRADLKADAKKDKWWERKFLGYEPEQSEYNAQGRLIRKRSRAIYDTQHRTWPPKVWKHYYALPEEIWTDSLMETLGSPASGVLLLTADRQGGLRINCVRPPKPNRDATTISPAAAVNIARLASLRMWETYQRLEQLQRSSAQEAA